MIGPTAPNISAAAATLDIHIDNAAVVQAAITIRRAGRPRESWTAWATSHASSFHRRAAAARAKPQRKSTSTGSADHCSTACGRYADPASAKTTGTETQSTKVGTQTGTHSDSHRTRQRPAMIP